MSLPSEINEQLKQFDSRINEFMGRRNNRMKAVAEHFKISHNALYSWFRQRKEFLNEEAKKRMDELKQQN